eukprot:364756-Chlamydomonas_euryale.AAC.6
MPAEKDDAQYSTAPGLSSLGTLKGHSGPATTVLPSGTAAGHTVPACLYRVVVAAPVIAAVVELTHAHENTPAATWALLLLGGTHKFRKEA